MRNKFNKMLIPILLFSISTSLESSLAGVGIGLLLADIIREDKRKKIGWRLFLVGAVSTIPLALDVLCKRK